MRTQPRIFISYRTNDSSAHAWQIYHRLAEAFHPEQAFIDKESIPYGVDFREYLEEAIRNCDAMLVVIGPKWLEIGPDGQLRIQQDDDVVRFEIQFAMSLNRLVIPVLVGGAVVPAVSLLPASLHPFLRKMAAKVDMEQHFRRDTDRLIEQVRAAVVKLPPKVKAGVEAVDAALRALNQGGLTEAAVARVLVAAIHHGCDIYNAGEHLGCAIVYERATQGLVAAIAANRHATPLMIQFRQQGDLALARFKTLGAENGNPAAWAFRENFDDFLDSLQAAVGTKADTVPDPIIPDRALRAALTEQVSAAGDEVRLILRQPSSQPPPVGAIHKALLVSIRYGNAFFGIKDFENCDRLHSQTVRQILDACQGAPKSSVVRAMVQPLAETLESLAATKALPPERAWKLYEAFVKILEQQG